MKLRALEAFLAVAEEGSFTRAARRMGLAQPSLSQHIRALEAELGGRLLERFPRGIRLTSAGKALLPEAPVGDATAAARAALEAPHSGPRFSELLASATRVAVVIDNQFRPTPASRLLPAVLDAIEAAGKPAVLACANGKVFPMSESDIEQKIGRENLARMERLGFPFHQNEPRNTEAYTY